MTDIPKAPVAVVANSVGNKMLPLLSRSLWLPVATPIICTSIVGIVMGLSWPLFSLALENQGHTVNVIGFSATCQALAFLLIAPFAPSIITRLGHHKTIAVAIAFLVCAFMGTAVLQSIYVWNFLRVVIGSASSLIFISTEIWLINEANKSRLGAVVGVFGFIWSISFALGPSILRFTGVTGPFPVVVPTLIIILAGFSLYISKAPTLSRIERPRARLVPLLMASPVLFIVILFQGVLDASNDTFLPLYAQQHGATLEQSVTVLSILLIGIACAQIPFGYAADRIPGRLLLLLATMSLGLSGVVLLEFVSFKEFFGASLTVFFIGFGVGGLWIMTLVMMGQRFSKKDLPNVSAARTVFYGMGSAIGPSAIGQAIWQFGYQMYPISLVAISILIMPFLVYSSKERAS